MKVDTSDLKHVNLILGSFGALFSKVGSPAVTKNGSLLSEADKNLGHRGV